MGLRDRDRRGQPLLLLQKSGYPPHYRLRCDQRLQGWFLLGYRTEGLQTRHDRPENRHFKICAWRLDLRQLCQYFQTAGFRGLPDRLQDPRLSGARSAQLESGVPFLRQAEKISGDDRRLAVPPHPDPEECRICACYRGFRHRSEQERRGSQHVQDPVELRL